MQFLYCLNLSCFLVGRSCGENFHSCGENGALSIRCQEKSLWVTSILDCRYLFEKQACNTLLSACQWKLGSNSFEYYLLRFVLTHNDVVSFNSYSRSFLIFDSSFFVPEDSIHHVSLSISFWLYVFSIVFMVQESRILCRARQMSIFWRRQFRELRPVHSDTFFWMGFLLEVSSNLFPLGNATCAIYAQNVPVMKIKHIWKDIF